MTHDDQALRMLIRRAQAGDEKAFGELYSAYFTPMFRYLYVRLGNRADAEDLTQTVFMKVFTALGTFREQKVSPLAYFFRVARNALIDHRKKKRETVFGEVEAIEEQPADENITKDAMRTDEKHELERGLRTLTEEQQEVVILKFIQGYSTKEVAEFLGKREPAIRQIQCRALRALRNVLGNRDLQNETIV